jgi:hypothetical protein
MVSADTIVQWPDRRGPDGIGRMKLNHEPFVIAPDNITDESLALALWYDSKPAVRRLWGIEHDRRLRVIVTLEPTLDNDDIYPVWLLNTGTWARELRSRIGRPVQLELFLASPWDIELDAGSVVIADLHWRDGTL